MVLSSAPLFCPRCAHSIEPKGGVNPGLISLAVRLQAERFGAEVHCPNCQRSFIYQHVMTVSAAEVGREIPVREQHRAAG